MFFVHRRKNTPSLLSLFFGMMLAAPSFSTPVQPPVDWSAVEMPSLRHAAVSVTTTELGRLSQVGGPADKTMTGLRPTLAFEFPMRRDEIITQAVLDLRWHASPALIPTRSQLVVKLNGEYQTTIPIPKERDGDVLKTRIRLNAKKLKDSNRLSFDFIGSYAPASVCENPASKTLWAAVDGGSILTLTHQRIRAADDLTLLPAPFVDPADRNPSTLAFSLPSDPTDAMLQAAGITASWAGVASDWRGIRAGVSFDAAPPERHFIVLITNKRRPLFLKDWPEARGPEITVADAPATDWAKMLVIAGRNDADLLVAARALATRGDTFTGNAVRITNLARVTPSEPYRVPKWIDTTRKTTLGDILDYEGQLNAKGIDLPPLRIDFRLPPDLFVMTRSSIPFDLKFRYSQPAADALSQLRLSLNESLVRTFPLMPEGDGTSRKTSDFAVVDTLSSYLNQIDIPAVLFSSNNRLKFDFAYGASISGGSPENCRTVTLIPNEVAIDPNSSLDFTGFYHFAPMPDLRLFAQSGYPFTIYGDLSQTTIVMPASPDANTTSAMLTTLARFSSQTGAAAHAVTVTTKPAPETLKDRDVLVFGIVPECLLQKNLEKPTLSLNPDSRLAAPDFVIRNVLAKAAADANDVNQITDMMARGPAAAIAGYESPITPGRSVVALMATPGAGETKLIDRLADPHALGDTGGTLSFVHASPALNFYAEPSYYSGDLPWHQRLWFRLLDSPLLLVLCTFFAIVLMGIMIYGLMYAHNKRRLRIAKTEKDRL